MSFKKKDVIKIVLLGAPQVGKRALISQFVNRKWNAESAAFDTYDVPKKMVAVEEKQVTLELYPVDSLDSMTSTLNGASCDGCLLCYDISSQESFDGITDLLAEFLSHSLILSQLTPPPIVIIGNKYDLSSTKRVVQKADVVQWTQSLHATLSSRATIPNVNQVQTKFESYEVSAKTADQIDTAFYRIARLALNLNHNMFAGTVSQQQFNALQQRLCLVDGCLQPRTVRGYCPSHGNAMDRASASAFKPEEVILPTLFALNKLVNNYNPRTSPYHLALLGSIRHLIISITHDKERTFQLVPQHENDIYKTQAQVNALQRSPKSDRGSIISLDQQRPIALPKILYQSILDINKTLMDLISIVTPPKDTGKKATKDDSRVAFTTIPLDQFQGESAPQRNRLPILDITVTTNIKNAPQHYNVLQRSVSGRKADLNSGSGGKDVYICVLRDAPDEPSMQSALIDIPTQNQRWNVYANGVQKPIDITRVDHVDGFAIEGSCISEELLKRAHQVLAQNPPNPITVAKPAAKPTPVKKGKRPKPEIKINLLSQLLPLTAINIASIVGKQREDAPFGFEIASNMPDSSLANLNAGTQSETQLYFALHRAGPGPDYQLYARDLFGEGKIDKGYIEGGKEDLYGNGGSRASFVSGQSEQVEVDPAANRDSLVHLDFHALARTASVLAAGPLTASITSPSFNGENRQILTPNDIYTMSKNPLTILTEDSRSMVPNYPVGGSRGPGAPIIDVNVFFPQRGEACPVDWHELNVTLLHQNAMLNTGTDGHEIKLAYKLDVEPVLDKVYRPFLETLHVRSNEANVLGIDNQLLIQFTQFCAILTCCLYSPNINLVVETLNIIKQLINPGANSKPNTGDEYLKPNDKHEKREETPVVEETPKEPVPGAKPPPPPPKSIISLLPPQIFNSFIHTICDAAPMLMGVLHKNERTALLELMDTVIDKTYTILSSYTTMRIVDVFALLRCTDMFPLGDPGSDSSHPTVDEQNANFLSSASSSYHLKNSLRLLKPIVTSANQSILKHHVGDVLQSPMQRLDPNGNYPRLVELILRQHVFDDGQVLLGRKKDPNAGTTLTAQSTPLLTKSPVVGGGGGRQSGNEPLAAPPTLPNTQMGHQSPLPQITITQQQHQHQQMSPLIGSMRPSSPALVASATPAGSGRGQKLSQNELVQKSRSQEEISTIINNVNNNPYDMCASLMRYLADQVISSKITDQEIGRLQRRSYGSQPTGDLACITDRLINDHHTQRNWLLDPPVGYSINPSLRQKVTMPTAPVPTPMALPLLALQGSGALTTRSPQIEALPAPSGLMGLPTLDSLASSSLNSSDLPLTFDQLSKNQTTPPELRPVSSLAGSIPEDGQAVTDPSGVTATTSESSTAMVAAAPPGGSSTTLNQILQSRKQLTVDVNLEQQAVALVLPPQQRLSLVGNTQKSYPYNTYTRVFHNDADLNPDGTQYQWKYFNLQYIKHETEAERRKRKKAEKKQAEKVEAMMDAMMMEEHRQELAARRIIIHNTQHLFSQNLIPYKAERTLLSLIIYLCKLASSDSDTNPLHASSIKSLVNINILGAPSVGMAYKAVSPYSVMAKDEMILRRVYALQLLHYILDKSDEFLKSNHASINVIRRYIVPAIINNTVTLVPSMFFISLKCFVILCEKYNAECQAEIGIILQDVFLDLLVSPAAPVEFKAQIFELLELVLNTPSKIINLYQTQDNSGQRNVYEKLLQTVSVIILQTQYAKADIGSVRVMDDIESGPTGRQLLFRRLNVSDAPLALPPQVTPRHAQSSDPTSPTRIEQVVHQYDSSSDPKKSTLDLAADRLRKCALRLLMHHLHMMAQWVGVPSVKRNLDATNALKLTCKSFLHVLITSETFPELITTSPDYSSAIRIAAKKLQMFFEAFPHTQSARPYIQMPGILEEVLRFETDQSLKQLLGLNSGLTRANATLTKAQLVNLTPKEQSFKDETNMRCVARQVMIESAKTGLCASSNVTIAQSQQQYARDAVTGESRLQSTLGAISHNSGDRSTAYSTNAATTPSNSSRLMRQRQGSKIITSPSIQTPGVSQSGGIPSTPISQSGKHSIPSFQHRGSIGGLGQANENMAQQNMLIQDDYDMDGGYIENKPEANTSGIPTLQQTFEKIGDEVCVDVVKLLGDLPPARGGLELGLDLGHYTAMDPYTISMLKNNPAFAMVLTSRSPLAKQRTEYSRVYKEASVHAKDKESLKDMLKFLKTNYPRWMTPYNIAQLLYQNPYVSPVVVGDYLSNQDDTYFNSDQFAQLRTAYTNLIDLSGMPFISALRYYLTNGGFRMPGEGQKISRMVESFCQAFTRDNPDEFANLDIAAVVCYATIMLNTELHNPSTLLIAKKNARPPMTLSEFINNIQSVGPAGRRTDILSLTSIYIEISGQAIEWIGENTNNDHFDTALTLEQLLLQAATGQPPPVAPQPVDGADQQSVALFHHRQNIKNQSKLRLLRRRALCDVRSVGPLSSRNDVTSSTQIMAVIWSHVWQFYLRSIASKMDSSPFFSPQSLRGGSSSSNNASGVNTSGIEHLKIDETDYETLHMCIDCLSYGAAVSIALGDHEARKPFMRALAKIVFLETSAHQMEELLTKDKKGEGEFNGHILSPQLQNRILSGEHYRQHWYTQIDSMASTSPVPACKMLLAIASNTKSSISFQRRQQILRTMEREFGGRDSINIASDTDRAFIRKQKLVKLSSSGKKQVYTFFLFNDMLIYAEEEGKDRYKVHQVLQLSLLRLVSLANLSKPLEDKRREAIEKVLDLREQIVQNNNVVNAHSNPQVLAQNQFLIAEINKITIPPQPPCRFKIISPQKSFIVECADQVEMESWVSLIQDCITKLLVKRSDWCLKARDAIKAGILHPDLMGAKRIHVDTKKNRIENKEDMVLSVMDEKGNVANISQFYQHDLARFQAYAKSCPKNTTPIPTDRSLQLKKYATFSGSPAYKLTKLAQEGFVPLSNPFCKLCLRPYAFRRSAKICQHCGEEVCSDCTKSIDCLIQPMVKVRSIRCCHACSGLLPAPTNSEGRGLIGDNQPMLTIGDDEDL